MKRNLLIASISSLLLTATLSVFAQPESEDDDLYLLYGDDEMISIATGFSQPIAKAPSTATVITAEDIKAMGATTIEHALESVPGLHYSLSTLTSLGQTNVRGIKTSITPQLLVMLNGYRISSELLSSVFSESAKINIQNISRIEVIRGPGSAVYGADAYSGVINIVTKNANELNGFTAGAKAGSHDTKNAWAQYGTEFNNGWDIAFNLEFAKQGEDTSQIISSDVQTGIDSFGLGAASSLAPGNLNYAYESTTYNLHINNDNWKIGLDGWMQRDVGQGAGVALALDPTGYGDFDHYLFSLEYNIKDWVENWDFTSKLSYQKIDAQYNFSIFPAGSSLLIGADGNAFSSPHNSACPNIPALGGPTCIVQFPDGYIGNPGRESTIPQLDIIALYDGFEAHNLRFNLGAKEEKMIANESKNFGPGIIDGLTPVVDGTLTDVTGTGSIYVEDTQRTIKYFSVQDVWDLAADWTLTAGIRYDDYSDFGGTTNPRLALVWNTSNKLTTKILYGSAFRAPSFAELSGQNNPVQAGNSDLKPETIDTTELAFSYLPSSNLSTNFNLYYFKAEDMISYSGPNGLAENADKLNGKGLEFDANWKINKQWNLLGNYAYQITEDDATNEQVAFVPQQQLYLDVRWKPITDWELTSQFNWVGDRERESADTRDDIDDYTLVNMTIRRRNILKNLEAAFVVYNVFDKAAYEPSAMNTIPDDFPLNERSLYLELSYHME